MSKAINDLKHEHEAIMFSLKLLKGMLDQFSGRRAEVRGDLLKYIGFLKIRRQVPPWERGRHPLPCYDQGRHVRERWSDRGHAGRTLPRGGVLLR